MDAETIPWTRAVRSRWDLVLTTRHEHVGEVSGEVLVFQPGAGTPARLDREPPTYRGRVLPSALALPHLTDVDVLWRTRPEVLPAAVVSGDICLDRMRASAHRRAAYRSALGVGPGTRLVTVCSTWGAESLFGRHPDLCDRLVDEAGDDTRVAAVLHPAIWAAHGKTRVLARARRAGLLVVPPESGWQATVLASDHVLGDLGSTTVYAAAMGIPVRLVAATHRAFPGGIADELARAVGRIDLGAALLPQLASAVDGSVGELITALVSSCPDEASERLRNVMYLLLGLDEPVWRAAVRPYAPPRPHDPP
ncbi:hypothetical protein V5P93_002134 [Actinokineospora auranticolor]|nr:hypothetical protein [Actinokineospora auranticolor]